MLVYPSVVFTETGLNILYDGAAVLPYWRAGIGVTRNPRECPPDPLGGLIVAWCPQKFNQFRYVCRIFYLSCMGPPGHHDGVDFNESTNLVLPASVEPGKPGVQRPTTFGRVGFVGSTVDRFRDLCKGNRKQWEAYAQQHGITLPNYIETFDGDHVPY